MKVSIGEEEDYSIYVLDPVTTTDIERLDYAEVPETTYDRWIQVLTAYHVVQREMKEARERQVAIADEWYNAQNWGKGDDQ